MGSDEMNFSDEGFHTDSQHVLTYAWVKLSQGKDGWLCMPLPLHRVNALKHMLAPSLHALEAVILPGWSYRNPWLSRLKPPHCMGHSADVI